MDSPGTTANGAHGMGVSPKTTPFGPAIFRPEVLPHRRQTGDLASRFG